MCLILLRKDFLKIFMRGRRKFDELSKNHLRFEGYPAIDLETHLVCAFVEGNGITYDIEVASQLSPNFFNPLLDHRSVFPG